MPERFDDLNELLFKIMAQGKQETTENKKHWLREKYDALPEDTKDQLFSKIHTLMKWREGEGLRSVMRDQIVKQIEDLFGQHGTGFEQYT